MFQPSVIYRANILYMNVPIYIPKYICIYTFFMRKKSKTIVYFLLRRSDIDIEENKNKITPVSVFFHLELIESFISENTE